MDRFVLKDKILKLNEMQQLEIYKILEKNKVKMTINKNGVFFDLNNLDSNIIGKLEKFVNFCKDNNNFISNSAIERDKIKDNIS